MIRQVLAATGLPLPLAVALYGAGGVVGAVVVWVLLVVWFGVGGQGQ